MSGGLKHGDVALGVEPALPAPARPAWPRSSARHFIRWLVAALRRRN